MIADHALAVELGGRQLVSPDVSRSRDGALLLVVALQAGSGGTIGQGCHALELASIDPPAVRRDATGRAIVRGIQTAAADAGWHTGACTHDPRSDRHRQRGRDDLRRRPRDRAAREWPATLTSPGRPWCRRAAAAHVTTIAA